MIKRGIFFAYLVTLDELCLLQWADVYFNSFKIHKNIKNKTSQVYLCDCMHYPYATIYDKNQVGLNVGYSSWIFVHVFLPLLCEHLTPD